MGEYIVDKHYFDTEFKVFAKTRGMQNATEILVTPVNSNSGVEK